MKTEKKKPNSVPVDPIELYLKDGDEFVKTKNWGCGVCRVISTSEHHARMCCAPRVCNRCGGDIVEKHWTQCCGCRDETAIKKEREKFEKAEKVSPADWDGGVFYGDEYFSELGGFIDNHVDDIVEAPPEYLWVAEPRQVVVIEEGRIIQEIIENDGWEDMTADSLDGIPEFVAAIRQFEEVNKTVFSYWESNTKALDLRGFIWNDHL